MRIWDDVDDFSRDGREVRDLSAQPSEVEAEEDGCLVFWRDGSLLWKSSRAGMVYLSITNVG